MSRAAWASTPRSCADSAGVRRPSTCTWIRQTNVARPLRLASSANSTSASATLPKWRARRVSLRCAYSRSSGARPSVRSFRTTFTVRVYGLPEGPVPRLFGRGFVPCRGREQVQDLLRQRDSLGEDPVQDLRAEAGWLEVRDHLSLSRRTFLLQHEDVLHRDGFHLHTHDLCDRRDLA